MSRDVKYPWLKKAIIHAIGKPLAREFDRTSMAVEQVQRNLLRRTVENCANTAYGRDHGFGSVKTVEDYQKAVPISDFEGHRPYVDRMTTGESDVLFPGRPLFYNTTSGTTNKPKYIPVSREYFENAYRKVSRLWLYSCLRDNPTVFDGKNLSSVGPEVEGHVADGTPHGALSGAVYRNVPGILKDVYSTPYPVMCMEDYNRKYYAMLRCGLAYSLTYIVCANPSSLLRFHQTVVDNYEDLVRDIRDGTLRSDVEKGLPADGHDEVMATFSPDPARAALLEKLMATHGDNLRPKHYWPELAVVNTWKQGNCAQCLPKLKDYYADTTHLREFGYQASEGRAGIVLGNDWEHSALTAHVYFFEFIPEEEREADNPTVLLAHQLEVGQRYYVLITNTSGLYRYDINDIIEVTGTYNQVPLFRFIRKGAGFTNLTGEKLTETQVLEAVDRVRVSSGIDVPNFTMCCDEANLCYKLYVEFPRNVQNGSKQAFADALDTTLRTINPEYDCKRGSERLAAPLLKELPPESYEALKTTLVNRGMAREGQYKVVYLQRKAAVLEVLEGMAVGG